MVNRLLESSAATSSDGGGRHSTGLGASSGDGDGAASRVKWSLPLVLQRDTEARLSEDLAESGLGAPAAGSTSWWWRQ